MSRLLRVIPMMVALATGPLAAQARPDTAGLAARVFKFRYLTGYQASSLVAPFIQSRGGGILNPGIINGGDAISVRETPALLAQIDSALKVNDHEPLSVQFQFQLISADDIPKREPAIIEIDSTLRNIFKFAGYHLLAQGFTTTVEDKGFVVTMDAGNEHFRIEGTVHGVNADAGKGAVSVGVSLRRDTPASMLNEKNPYMPTLLSTTLTAPFGQTVVLGSASPAAGGKALILTVRPRLVAK